jgi:hypothetical protein
MDIIRKRQRNPEPGCKPLGLLQPLAIKHALAPCGRNRITRLRYCRLLVSRLGLGAKYRLSVCHERARRRDQTQPYK